MTPFLVPQPPWQAYLRSLFFVFIVSFLNHLVFFSWPFFLIRLLAVGYTLSLEWSWRSASGQQISMRHWKFVTLSHSAHWIVWETQNDGNVMALGNLITRSCNLAAAAIFGLGVLEDMGTIF